MRKKSRKLALLVLLLTLMSGVCYNHMLSTEAANEVKSKIHFINLGTGAYTEANGNSSKGNATIVESTTKSGQKVYGLIDSGTVTRFKNKVAPALDKLGISSKGTIPLSFIIVTHLDGDHASGVIEAMKGYCNSSTVLYIKDSRSNLESRIKSPKSAEDKEIAQKYLDRCNAIFSSAKAIDMDIVKIRPITSVPAYKSMADLELKLNDSNMMKTKLDVYDHDSGYALTETKYDIQLGEFTIQLFNGNDWNKQTFIPKWDENVNSVTTFIRCNTYENSKIYSTYLGSDLGITTSKLNSGFISEKAVAAMGKKVSIYQVAHHGCYNSMSKACAAALDFKYAIVTSSYQEIARKGVVHFYNYPNQATDFDKDGLIDENEALSAGTNTLKNLTNSSSLIKVFFTSGSNNTKNPTPIDNIISAGNKDYHIVNVLADSTKKYLEYVDSMNKQLKYGNITATFGSESMSVTQQQD